MYAIVKTGGKQYKVAEGDVLFVEKLEVGAPTVEGASVQAKVVEQGKAKKVIVFKYKAKKDYRRKQGHRQPYTKIVIEKINA